MNPDQTPAPHLLMLLPTTAVLLQRTQSSLGLLRDVVQESSAEYWYERGEAAIAHEDWDEVISAFQHYLSRSKDSLSNGISLEIVLRNSIRNLCQNLTQKRVDTKYVRLRESKYEGGSAYGHFDENLWRNDNEDLFNRIVEFYALLSQISKSTALKAVIWNEAAKTFDGLPFRHPKLASYCYCKSFTFEGKFETYISECRQCEYYHFWSNWPDCWSRERIMSFDSAIKQFPNYSYAYWARGERFLASENYKKAADDFETYFQLGGPEHRWKYQVLAGTYFKLNNKEGLAHALFGVTRLGGKMAVIDSELIDLNKDELPF